MTDDFSRGVLYPVLRSGMGLEQKTFLSPRMIAARSFPLASSRQSCP